MSERQAERIGRMLSAANDALAYVEGMDKDDFVADKRTQQAVVLNLLLIGEISAKLLIENPALIAARPDIPWRGMKGMRNRIAHGYFEIDLNIVWDTVRYALPDLIAKLSSRQQG